MGEKIRISENKLHIFTENVIKQILKEYLSKNVVQLKKDLTTSYGKRVGCGYRKPTGEIIKNEWLLHCTSFNRAKKILQNGFKGYDSLKCSVTNGRAKMGGSAAFAFPLDRDKDMEMTNAAAKNYYSNSDSHHHHYYDSDDDDHNDHNHEHKTNSSDNVTNMFYDFIPESEVIIVFQANGFVDYYIPDASTEVLFDVSTVHNMFPIIRIPDGSICDIVYVIPLKNGRFVFLNSDEYLTTNKVYEWVSNNYATYKNAIQTTLPKSLAYYDKMALKQLKQFKKHQNKK